MRALIASSILLLAAAGCRGKAAGQKNELPPAAGPQAPPLPSLPSVAPEKPPTSPAPRSEERTTGTLYPRAEAALAPNASGVIAEILVQEGSPVKKGAVVFRLDAADHALRRQQAAAALEAARVNLRATKVEHDRTKAMFEQNAVNRAAWDQVVARHDAAVVGVRQAEVALAVAQKAVADTAVRSPLDGVVTAKLKNVGETATMMPPTVVLVVQDQAVLELRFRLTERALTRVKPGDTVRARFDAVGLTRDARVVRTSPTVDMRTRTIEVVTEIDNRDGALRPGLLADVDLQAAAAPADGGAR
jgi:RND family efflux transporter MFP subunit